MRYFRAGYRERAGAEHVRRGPLGVCVASVCMLVAACAGPDAGNAERRIKEYAPVRYDWDIAVPLDGQAREVATFAMETVVLEKRVKAEPEFTDDYKDRVDTDRFELTEKALGKSRNLWETGGVMLRAIAVNPVAPLYLESAGEWEVIVCSYNTPGLYLYSDENRDDLILDPAPPSWYRPRVVANSVSNDQGRGANGVEFTMVDIGHTYYSGGVNGPDSYDGALPPCKDFTPVPSVQKPPSPLPVGDS